MRRLALAAALVLVFVAARQRSVRPPIPAPNASPTFNKDVVRIFQANCQTCHHPGGGAPFSLMSYSDAFPNRLAIKLMTKSGQMPPWKPVAACGTFDGERRLTQDEIDTISTWVDAGAPEGQASDLPAPLQFSSDWQLGEPDLVLSYPQPYTPPASGEDMYRCFPVPTNLTADKYVAAVDYKPGDPATVHHVIAYLDTTGVSAQLDQDDPAPGYKCFGGPGFLPLSTTAATLGGWAPGAQATTLPDGVAMSLPAATRVVLQVHYHVHSGAPKPDTTRIGIYYAKSKPKKLMRIWPLINFLFTIPPNDPNYRVTASLPVTQDAHAILIAPHMHLLGRKMQVQATLPSGTTECLINIADWDFNWQGMYRYATPVALPAGTRLSLEAFYDNSSNNPRNPNNPPKAVSWGEETTDEMCIAFVGVTLDAENLN
jgi:mono/diheme cytochrome c family protein